MSEALTLSALQYACRRVEDFALVNSSREGSEKLETVEFWMDGLGFDEPLRFEFVQWIQRFVGPDCDDGSIMMGLMVGLFINQFNHDGHP